MLPLQLDKAAIPDDIKNAIYARNIISVGGRGADLVADRIIDALPAKKSRLPIAFIAGGAALLTGRDRLSAPGGSDGRGTGPDQMCRGHR